jgi:putative SOS response-associated peptidase YedK
LAISSSNALVALAPSWNVAPTDPMSVVRFDPKAQQRRLDVTRWGY